MMHLAIIERDPVRMETIREWLLDYSRKQNCYFDAIKVSVANPADIIGKYVAQLQIALIDLDNDGGEKCGDTLYKMNPDCRILYYRSEPCSLVPLLSSRPISFFLWPKGRNAFLERFDAVCKEVAFAQTTFRYETKSRIYLLAKRNILYFQSDLRYIDIHMQHDENPRILAKLNEIEAIAGDVFVRIHKSFLVNAKHILWLDKKNHQILISNGEQLPISDAQYDNVCVKLRGML